MADSPIPAPLNAVSEQGTQIRHTDEEVNTSLRLLIFNGGGLAKTSRQLEEQGIKVGRDALRKWRTDLFPRRFAQFRNEMTPEVRGEIAGNALEIARLASKVEKKLLAATAVRIDEVDANHLAKNAQAVASAKATNVQTAQLLEDKPTQIVETRSLDDQLAILERLGVLKKDPAIDVEVLGEDES